MVFSSKTRNINKWTNLYTLEVEQTNIKERVSEEASQIVAKEIKVKSSHTKINI